MLNYQIRTAIPEDALAISTLIMTMSFEEIGDEGYPEELDHWRRDHASLKLINEKILDEKVMFLVAEAYGNSREESIGLVGVVYASIESQRHGHIEGLYSGVHKRGVGKALIQEMNHKLVLECLDNIEIVIPKSNIRMKRLISGAGFHKIKDTDKDLYYADGNFELWEKILFEEH